MLSKLRYEDVVFSKDVMSDSLKSVLISSLLEKGLEELKIFNRGTSGLCLVGDLQGQTRFFKTYLNSAGQKLLKREAALLEATSGKRTDVCILTVGSGDKVQTWLHMKLLRPCDNLPPEKVRGLVAGYEQALHSFSQDDLIPETDSTALLLREAQVGLETLADQELISQSLHIQVLACLEQIEIHCSEWPKQLCHGDLGSANIMADIDGSVAIDWEDAFWGVAGYDYLYWLTFFNNRRWLSSEYLGYTGLGLYNEVALMVMILILKSFLSLRNGSYIKNCMSFDQRIREVLDIV